MSIAVLSPCLLDVEKGLSLGEKQLHYYQLSELFQKLNTYTNFKFQYYKKAPFAGYKMELPSYGNLYLDSLVATNVYGAIQRMLMEEYIDLEGIAPATPPPTFSLPDGDLTNAFYSYLNYCQGKETILFIGENNFGTSRPIEFVSDKKFSVDASTYVSIELTDILLSYLKPPADKDVVFPRKDFCVEYNNYVLERIQNERMNQPEKISLFETIGELVATYNLYKKDQRLSNINSTPQKLRKVYKKAEGKIYYLSLDVESGGFEVFDKNYLHLGQYNFSGDIAKPPATHTLRH